MWVLLPNHSAKLRVNSLSGPRFRCLLGSWPLHSVDKTALVIICFFAIFNKGDYMVELVTEKISVPEGCNIIFGQTHFIRSAEHLYSCLVESVPGIKFGLAFAEASGDCLIRTEGTDEELVNVAGRELAKIGAGHTFLIFLRNAFPINVLNAVKQTSEVACVYCATANQVEVILAQTEQGRGVLGIVDGSSNKGIEQPADVAKRREFLKKIGYTPK